MLEAPINFRDPKATADFIRAAFSDDQRRLRHIEVIAERVRESAKRLQLGKGGLEIDPDLAYCAALVHDIGYLHGIRNTGFHPADGANFLRARGFADLADLIESHSCSPEEASILGQARIPISDHIVAKLITYWDMRVKQGGDTVSYEERLADILARYGETSAVGQANLMAKKRLKSLSAEVEALLRAAEQDLPSQARALE